MDDSIQTTRIPAPSVLRIEPERGKLLVQIGPPPECKVEIGTDYSQDDAARALWDLVARYAAGAFRQQVLVERERCAKLAEEHMGRWVDTKGWFALEDCAAAIRSQGEGRSASDE